MHIAMWNAMKDFPDDDGPPIQETPASVIHPSIRNSRRLRATLWRSPHSTVLKRDGLIDVRGRKRGVLSASS